MAAELQNPNGRTELPTDFAERAADVTGLDEPPATLEAWWTAVLEQYSDNDVAVELSDRYSESPTRHEVRDQRRTWSGRQPEPVAPPAP